MTRSKRVNNKDMVTVVKKKSKSSTLKPSIKKMKQNRTVRVVTRSVVPEKKEIIAGGRHLIGLKIKVWWPEDRQFYGGIIQQYNAQKKTHTILYDDGDKETLNLQKEKWHVIIRGASESISPVVENFEGNLVGSYIQVFWPTDHMLYDARIMSYDALKKKYNISYFDGAKGTLDARKHIWQVTENLNMEEYGENLVGSRIKVWWPLELRFFAGTVMSYHADAKTKKHMIKYADGDEEMLNLKSQRWQFIENDSEWGEGSSRKSKGKKTARKQNKSRG
ncbi:hypothetical protein ACFE04_008790 [Oxalis oulophora]